MDSHRTIAEAYQRALECGLPVIPEVSAWVDRVITEEPRPSFAMIEASSASGDPSAFLTALRGVPGVADPHGRRRLLFAIMFRTLERDPNTIHAIVRGLFSMAVDGDIPDSDAARCMWYFDDALGLAEEGVHGRVEDVRRDLVEFLREFGEVT